MKTIAIACLLLIAPLFAGCDLLDDLGRYSGERQHHPLKAEPAKPKSQPVKPLQCGKGCEDFVRAK